MIICIPRVTTINCVIGAAKATYSLHILGSPEYYRYRTAINNLLSLYHNDYNGVKYNDISDIFLLFLAALYLYRLSGIYI